MGTDVKSLLLYYNTIKCIMASLIAFFRSHHKQRQNNRLDGLLLILKWQFLNEYSSIHFYIFKLLLSPTVFMPKENISSKDIQHITTFERWKDRKLDLSVF